ncbi:hypothetical protein K505DRAFT_329836 [Melanomma pulvis-pyrius CBS 109.77]|uniref:Uncharacterized protein n=1 Tax=Melanomma pulvis-pyrius CBS 109.77 TaxID=1314802 RepID=A0A6A6WSU5_9PLEO|nr:hypothetical protein K505DRAFT_329836 [Melanomma pulvis-pyrius CBS 109.77]
MGRLVRLWLSGLRLGWVWVCSMVVVFILSFLFFFVPGLVLSKIEFEWVWGREGGVVVIGSTSTTRGRVRWRLAAA